MMPIDLSHLKQWVGKQETAQDQIYPTPVQAMALSLNHDAASILKAPLRPVWHWLYFLPMSPLSEAGPDGHPARGGFLPPVPLPRRMWASSELSFHEPIAIGDTLKRTSTIESVDHKQRRSDDLALVTVNHQVHRGLPLYIEEYHLLVSRQMPAPEAQIPSPPPAPPRAQWSRSVTPEPDLLVRYSTLTINSHRIQYHAPYTPEVEGYPG